MVGSNFKGEKLMYAHDFAYWLQGFFELSEETPALSKKQVRVIQNHLNLVFKHEIDDKYAGNKQELQDIHEGKPKPPKKDPLIRC